MRNRLHEIGRELKRDRRAKTVVVITTPGFAGLGLIPRLASFTVARPDVDVRISAGYAIVNLDRGGFDLAIRYPSEDAIDAGAELLFGDVVLPVKPASVLQLAQFDQLSMRPSRAGRGAGPQPAAQADDGRTQSRRAVQRVASESGS